LVQLTLFLRYRALWCFVSCSHSASVNDSSGPTVKFNESSLEPNADGTLKPLLQLAASYASRAIHMQVGRALLPRVGAIVVEAHPSPGTRLFHDHVVL
jgi:hypothetical protein